MIEKKFGLIGNPLKNQFSVNYFTEKFKSLGLPFEYCNYEIVDPGLLEGFIKNNDSLRGLNVTKPYKKSVIPFLDELSEEALVCGAVNCISFLPNGKTKGYNTDVYGFGKSLQGFLNGQTIPQAMILGDGGASKAVAFVLNSMRIPYIQVSRKANTQNGFTGFEALNTELLKSCPLIINATPVGMYPDIDELLSLPYEGIGSGHYCFDLIYLPEKPSFLATAEAKGAKICNGLEMLHLQADKAFDIWMKQIT